MLLDDRSDPDVLLVDAATAAEVTAGEVRRRALQLGLLAGAPGLVFLDAGNSLESIRDFLAMLEARIPVALIDPGLDEGLRSRLIQRYRPDLLLQSSRPALQDFKEAGPGAWLASDAGPRSHPELAVLLTTSGSTGSPKLVRLSGGNILANAHQIAESLGLRPDDRGVTAMPLFYSFGMSVVTSHLAAGSSVVVTDGGVLDQRFWDDLDTFAVTFLPGVPPTFAMVKRLGFADRDLPHLRAMIQAGGRLDPELVNHFSREMRTRGGEFFVMYGQTEAAPRISCLPPGMLPEKVGSVGVALRGGHLSAQNGDEVLPARQVGEIVYTGPNVMMGYAQSRTDLSLGHVYGSSLRTGDLGFLDEDGFLFLTGRSKRIAKIAGSRVSLDEIEAMVPELAPAAAVDAGDAGVALFSACADPDTASASRRQLARRLHVPVKLLTVRLVGQLPLLPNGKVDYRTLTDMAIGAEE